MAADLFTACGGTLVADSASALTAQFPTCESALNVARRLQRALYSFTADRETAGLAASILIFKPEEQIYGPDSAVSVTGPAAAAPGQIVVSNSAHESLRSLPGLVFRETPLDGAGTPAPFHEVLWMDPAALDSWRVRVAVAQSEMQRVEEEYPGAPEASASSGLPEEDLLPSEYPSSRLADQTEVVHESQVPADQRKRWSWAIAAAVLTMLLLAAGVFQLRESRSKTAGAPSVTPQNLSAPPAQRPATTEQGPQPGDKAGASAEPGGEVSANPKTEIQPPTKGSRKTREQTRETQESISEYAGFTAKQIPQLIKKAEEDAGAGDYESAKREYEIVLHLQPGNPSAREGLHKLSLKMGEQ